MGLEITGLRNGWYMLRVERALILVSFRLGMTYLFGRVSLGNRSLVSIHHNIEVH